MEGEGHFEFRKEVRPGKCPVRFCRKDSRAGGGVARKHRLCSKHRSILTRILDPVRTTFLEKKSNAKTRGIEWKLTLEEYREVVMQQEYMDNKGCTRHCLHLDRKEATKGYEVGNLQVITCAENVAKGNKERRKGYVHIPEVGDDNCPF